MSVRDIQIFPFVGLLKIHGGMYSTEIYNNNEWTAGPYLPKPFIQACVTQLNTTHTIITGGYTCERCTFLLDWTKSNPRWMKMASMKHGRRDHACISLPQGELMVANGHYLRSVEIYNPLQNVWRKGVSTPFTRYLGSIVLIKNSTPMIVGGVNEEGFFETRLYVLKDSSWIQLDIKLDASWKYRPYHYHYHFGFVSTMIPIPLLPNCTKIS